MEKIIVWASLLCANNVKELKEAYEELKNIKP